MEAQTLFKELLIGVTNFFRDPKSFEALKEKVIPRIFENREKQRSVRVWVPGCTTGEEAYSIAILLQEHMDAIKGEFGIQIFGTDIDPDAVETARIGLYPHSISADVSPDRLKRFFNREDTHYRVKKDVRERVVFAVQNVVSDPPFSKLDLVSCRNLLIYMDAELQKRIVPLFHYALNTDGFLFLGTSETIGGSTNLFSVIDRKHKLFQRKETAARGEAGVDMPLHPINGGSAPRPDPRERHPLTRTTNRDLAEQSLLQSYSACGALINEKQEVVYFHGQTGAYLEPAQGEVNWNIVAMAREGLKIELANAIRRAGTQKKTVRRERLSVKSNGGEHIINLVVHPVMEPPSKRGLMMIVFEGVHHDVAKQVEKPETKRTAKEKDRRVRELEQELESAKQYLQTAIEELETSNEGLKATNEELQSANEELQSTNEELETAKEEQQSVNEELVTVNAELQQKIDQLTKANDDMNNLLASTQIGTVFIDNDLKVKRFTPAATDLINLLPSDLGRPVSHIASNLSYDRIVEDIEETLRTLNPKEVEVETKDGQCYSMRIRPYRTSENVIDGVVIAFVDISEQSRMREIVEESRRFAESIVDTAREPLLVLDENIRVVSANRSFYKTFAVTKEKTEGRRLYELGNHQWDVPRLRELLERVLPDKKEVEDFKVDHEFEGIGRRVMLLNARQLERGGGRTQMILLAIEDITCRPRD
jgi:two-component system CheB/CheR fusion protein